MSLGDANVVIAAALLWLHRGYSHAHLGDAHQPFYAFSNPDTTHTLRKHDEKGLQYAMALHFKGGEAKKEAKQRQCRERGIKGGVAKTETMQGK